MSHVRRKLDRFITRYQSAHGPFDWATHNCAHFAANWVSFLREQEECISLPPFAGAAEVRKFFVAKNSTIEDLITEQLKVLPKLPFEAKMGDIVLIDMPEKWFLAIAVYAEPFCVMLGENGNVVIGSLPIRKAWSVLNVT